MIEETPEQRMERERQESINTKIAEIGTKAIPFGELIRRFSPEPIPRIPGVLPSADEARRIFVTAPSKNLKTWFVYELVYSLGTGEDFLNQIGLVHGENQLMMDEDGEPVMHRVKKDGAGEPLRTLYLQMENTEYSMEVRGRAIAEGHGHTVQPEDPSDDEDFIMVVPRLELDLLDSVHAEALVAVAKDFDIVVMDSTYNMVMRTLNDDEVAKMLTRVINKMVDETGATVIAIHHASTKGEGGGSKGRESMGSTFFTSAFWDHEIRLNYDRDARQLDLRFVSRDTDYEDLSFRFIAPGLWETVDVDAEVHSLIPKIREWEDEDEKNRTWVANNGVRIAGEFSSQIDLATHLETRVDLLKEAVKRKEAHDNLPHLPDTIGDGNE